MDRSSTLPFLRLVAERVRVKHSLGGLCPSAAPLAPNAVAHIIGGRARRGAGASPAVQLVEAEVSALENDSDHFAPPFRAVFFASGTLTRCAGCAAFHRARTSGWNGASAFRSLRAITPRSSTGRFTFA